ncbi:glycerate kinase [Halopolyspora algeriensis]|uniref:Glycerate kinase n=1 Tax=Halopolyspora algeriensis TaxID=1500506 RepID=A0A368VWX4_9ACTN|nr:glycerate kinase [Halopolyspora algeriensis]RCW46706.1 glycerate kinase [Halopolyspora algeriensis]TQM46731.1 glycerate kinase [Halopolyspora algeriensis]
MPGHILIAPDKFKGSLSGPEVAEAVSAGLRRGRPDVEVRCTPVADGGDGTVQAALAAGDCRRVPVQATGPTGEPVDTEVAVRGDTAVVELAAASGLARLDEDELAPLSASSDGTGELIRAALDTGARTIVLGVGGSACTDGGAGMLVALGARVLDAQGYPLPPGGSPLARVSEVDLSGLDSRLSETEFILASDVDNPLHGRSGAAHVYGPQKGADPEQVELLDSVLQRWAEAVVAAGGRDVAGEPGAGAAGGVGFAALAVLGARRRAGVDMVLELVGFEEQLEGARLVVTGEGSLDEQTLHGKAPAGVAERAVAAGVPVVAVAGRCALSSARLHDSGFAGVYTVAELESDSERSMREAATLLESLGEKLAEEWL